MDPLAGRQLGHQAPDFVLHDLKVGASRRALRKRAHPQERRMSPVLPTEGGKHVPDAFRARAADHGEFA
jgi:hypothetical protein